MTWMQHAPRSSQQEFGLCARVAPMSAGMGRPMGGALGSQHSMRGFPCSGVSASPRRLGVRGQMSPLAWGLRGRNDREKVRVVWWRRAVVVPACTYPREAEGGIDPLRGLPAYGLRCSGPYAGWNTCQ